jgi:DNA recombination protein RmuC
METIAYISFGLLTGALLGYLIASLRYKNSTSVEALTGIDPEKHESTLAQLRQTEKDLVEAQTRLDGAIQEFKKQDLRIKDLEEAKDRLTVDLTKAQSDAENLTEQKKELTELREKMKKEFEGMAATILQKNAESFSGLQEKRLGEILNPFKEKIKGFEEKVQQNYEQEFKEKATLKAEIEKLVELNQTISKEAKDLTQALKGDSKKQGNWGEVVLERVLEQSGLEKGREYFTQFATQNVDGERILPDVVVNLPEEKHIIIDSKVSLVAYENYVNADEEELRAAALKAHLVSVKNHIKQLSGKNYQTGNGLESPDFVLLFMPIEAAFALAVQQDASLFSEAWKQKIVIVSPSTLLATLRTIASIWKQERQTKNAQEIALEGGRLYDKIVGFLKDMEKIDRNLSQTRDAYEAAMNKLSEGKGTILKRTEKLRKLGASVTKEIDRRYLDEEDDETTANIEA